jgi:Zn-dependent protease
MINSNSLLFLIPALIIAITIHEFCHALMADKLGDPTPRSQGRLSLNPLRHLDLLGTIMLLLVHFGWGKPVVIDPYNLKNPKRDEMLISLAGPASNLLLATVLSIIVRFIKLDIFSIFLFEKIIEMNVILAVFNLIPIPPLDGSKILLNLLPPDSSAQWQEAFERYGFILLIMFLFLPINGSNLVNIIMTPILRVIFNFLSFGSGL